RAPEGGGAGPTRSARAGSRGPPCRRAERPRGRAAAATPHPTRSPPAGGRPRIPRRSTPGTRGPIGRAGRTGPGRRRRRGRGPRALAGELQDERGVDALVGVKDLGVVERDGAGETTAEDLADLVLLADRAHERGVARGRGPFPGIVDGEPPQPISGEPLEEDA